MRVLCLTDFTVPEGKKWLWDDLPAQQDQVEFMSVRLDDRHQHWGKFSRYYPQLVQLGLDAYQRLKRDKFDLVVAWEGKNGFPLAFLRSLVGQRTPPLVILSFSIRGPLKAFHFIQRIGVRGMDYATVPTHYERSYYARMLRIPEDRIYHCPIGTHDMFGNVPETAPGEMIFSGGRSGRDYQTLFQAVAGLPYRVIVNARSFNVKNLVIPANVEINDLMPWYEYSRMLKQARFVIVPLQQVTEAVGLSVILDAMAAGRAVLVSDIPGPSEYVLPGETGLLVPPGDARAMREAVEVLWSKPELCAEMGRRGRKLYEEKYAFPKFSERVHGILSEILASR